MDERTERLIAANERLRQASRRLGEANAEVEAAEREQREAWEAVTALESPTSASTESKP